MCLQVTYQTILLKNFLRFDVKLFCVSNKSVHHLFDESEILFREIFCIKLKNYQWEYIL